MTNVNGWMERVRQELILEIISTLLEDHVRIHVKRLLLETLQEQLIELLKHKEE